jgi:putative transposase
MDERSVLTSLSEDERDAALQRFHLLQPHLEGGALLTQLARAEGIPLRTVRRWVRQYRHHGLAGLVRKQRKDRGTHRFPTELVHLVEGLALRRPPLSAAAIHRQIVPIAQEHGWSIPSYSTVYSLIHHLDPGLVMLAQKGAKAYNERFDLLYRREADRPNEIWQADHSPLDLWILDEAGGVVRPWLTVILDDYSRAVAGYRLLLHEPSTRQTALTLRQAIWRKDDPRWHVCGIPKIFYTDHGADFTSDHMEQVAIDLPMQLIFSRCPAWSRPDRALLRDAEPALPLHPLGLQSGRRPSGQSDTHPG